MKKTVKEIFEESRESYAAMYNNEKAFDSVFLSDGKATIPSAGCGSWDVDLEELQRDYLLIVVSVAEFHVMCRAIPKGGANMHRMIDVFLDHTRPGTSS